MAARVCFDDRQKPTLPLRVLASRKRPSCVRLLMRFSGRGTADTGPNKSPGTPGARERARAQLLSRDAESMHRADMRAVN